MDAFFIHLTEENNIYGAFAKEITADEEPIFYELDIEKYLTRISKNSPTSIGGKMNCYLLHSAIVDM